MVRFSRKRLFYLIFAGYIAISVIGSFSLSAAEPLRSVSLEMENSDSDNLFGLPDNRFIQYPAEEPVFITRTYNIQSSPLRMGFHRIASLPGSPNIGDPFSKSPFKAGIKTRHISLKNDILLKLRI
jgi:hypothetical protein